MTRLDGLRGVLAVYVMLVHAMPFVPLPGPIRVAFDHGEGAVDLFFCLSGLVVVQSLERYGFAPWPFLRARARRLLPVYFTVLAFAVAMLTMGSPLPDMPWLAPGSPGLNFWGVPDAVFWHCLAHAALLQGVIPQGALPWVYITVLPPAWSLSTEWQFYLLVAALRLRRLAVLAIYLLAVAALYRVLAPELPAYWQFSKAFLPDAAGYFALGVASAVLLRGGGAWVFGVVLVGVCSLEFVSGAPWRALTPMVWVWVLLGEKWPQWMAGVVSKVMGDAPPPRRAGGAYPSYRFLDWRVVQWLGAISYPLYLLNEPVQRGCAMIVAPLARGDVTAFTVVWLPLAVIMPVLAAAVVHRAVEVQGMVSGALPRWIASSRSPPRPTSRGSSQ
jgi:peptidoglycan/LPS O-acetylase OafA/YrhL